MEVLHIAQRLPSVLTAFSFVCEYFHCCEGLWCSGDNGMLPEVALNTHLGFVPFFTTPRWHMDEWYLLG
jgi:hypothetical protein